MPHSDRRVQVSAGARGPGGGRAAPRATRLRGSPPGGPGGGGGGAGGGTDRSPGGTTGPHGDGSEPAWTVPSGSAPLVNCEAEASGGETIPRLTPNGSLGTAWASHRGHPRASPPHPHPPCPVRMGTRLQRAWQQTVRHDRFGSGLRAAKLCSPRRGIA